MILIDELSGSATLCLEIELCFQCIVIRKNPANDLIGNHGWVGSNDSGGVGMEAPSASSMRSINFPMAVRLSLQAKISGRLSASEIGTVVFQRWIKVSGLKAIGQACILLTGGSG